MNWQRDIAQTIVTPLYQQMDGMICFLLVGSAARGLQTAHSDVDAVVYWQAIPSEAQRILAIEQANGVVHEIGDSSEGETDPALQSQTDVFYVLGDRMTGVKIDVTHKSINSVESLIQSVVKNHDDRRIKLAMIHGMQRGLPLYGETWMEMQLTKIGNQLPEAVVKSLIVKHVRFNTTWIYDHLTDRPDPVYDYQMRLRHIESMLMTLSAINRLYMPYEFKHLAAFVDESPVKPVNLLQDITTILNGDPSTAKQLITQLGDAIYDFVERHSPQLDIQEAREFFHYARPKHETSPMRENPSNANSKQHNNQPIEHKKEIQSNA